MSLLLDTCVLSEVVRPRPDPAVLDWIAGQPEHTLFLSVITIGELAKGASKLADGPRRQEIETWIEGDLARRFRDRLLPVDLAVARSWGEMLGAAERRGTPLPAIDALIAATAHVHGCAVVTRNEIDLRPTGIEVVNPWKGA